MDIPLTVLFFSIFLIPGIILYAVAFHFLKIKHLIQNTPTSKIRSVAMGFAEVCGKVLPIENGVFVSPFSNQNCVYYRYFIDEYRSTGKSSAWITVKKDVRQSMFYIKDETGKILVDPNMAKIDISKGNVYYSSLGHDPPYNIIDFLQRVHISFEGPLFGINKKMRYTEYIIKPNDILN